eukprot:m.237511 g.237511  ORF g.237511 m.237511 type:complete len:64 (+) comp13152_c0_seq1:94-285(+)
MPVPFGALIIAGLVVSTALVVVLRSKWGPQATIPEERRDPWGQVVDEIRDLQKKQEEAKAHSE